MQQTGKVVALFSNTAASLLHFRRAVIEDLIGLSCRVVLIASPDGKSEHILQDIGAEFIPVPLSRSGMNPFVELGTIVSLYRILSRLKPDVLINYSIKPNTYGVMIARAIGIPTIGIVTGLGFAFLHTSIRALLARKLMRMSLSLASHIFFLNTSDRAVVCGSDARMHARSSVLPGEGIDVAYYSQTSMPPAPVRFMMVSRILADKGFREFIGAARQIVAEHEDVCFAILGPLDPDNPAAIGEEELQQSTTDPRITYLGTAEDVRPLISTAHCIVLPSYREGLSRVLLEAGAISRPTIATNVPGCIDFVIDEETGFVCEPADVDSLKSCMTRFLGLDRARQEKMGRSARKRVENCFSNEVVLARYHEVLNQIGHLNIDTTSTKAADAR